MVLVNRILLDARQGSLSFSVGFSILRFSAYEKELKHEHVIIEILRRNWLSCLGMLYIFEWLPGK